MAKKDKKAMSVLNALKCLNDFSQVELQRFESLLKQPDQRAKLLKELRLPINKGLLIKKIDLNKVIIDHDIILKCCDLETLSEIEQQVSLDIKKDSLIKKINDKKIPITKHVIEQIILAADIKALNYLINSLLAKIKLDLGQLKFRDSESKSVSVIPIYTPMGNKR